MSKSYISRFLRDVVRGLDKDRCAYCMTLSLLIGMALELDHIIPESRNGATEIHNLCQICPQCNRHKYNKIDAQDPLSMKRVLLFHPRQQQWHEHFIWSADGILITGVTDVGRATVEALQMNNPFVVRSRRLWVRFGEHPPS